MAAISPGTPPYSLLDALRGAWSEVLTQRLHANWSVEIDSSEIVTPVENTDPCFQLSIVGGLQGNVFVHMSTADAIVLAKKALPGPAGDSAGLNDGRKAALQKLLQQAADVAANALRSLFGESKIEVSVVEPATWQGVNVALLASEAATGKLRLGVCLSQELLASATSSKVATPSGNPAASADPTGGPTSQEPNFDLLLGVNLEVTLRFGQRNLSLREILDFNAGAIIELDREVQEPADLLLGEKVIARGQVVIVDGNYGLRVTEIVESRDGGSFAPPVSLKA